MPRPRNSPSPTVRPSSATTDRFRRVDAYRARREWLRYEGTPQRDLFRVLRERFLLRHAVSNGWALDAGSGPGRFLPYLGSAACRRVALDLSREMLVGVPNRAEREREGRVDRVVGDVTRPPFPDGTFSEVALLGNTAGFAGDQAEAVVGCAARLAAPQATLVVEVAPGPGERSHYLARLPASAVARLLRSPPPAVWNRARAEGFSRERERHTTPATFRRFTVVAITTLLAGHGWAVDEVEAIAPLLGPDPIRVSAVQKDRKAWNNLLELEESAGRLPERWKDAAAVLVSARRSA